MNSNRQLAAIMFTDIVGYTALMGNNERKTLQSLEQFKLIAKPLVEQYQGNWHKDLGDGALISFSNVLDAVHCALAIQHEINNKVDFRLRMGIHLGDVTYKDGDVFGDGINIASRIQSEAAPGGICISESVYKTVRNNEEIQTVFLANRKLKNVHGKIRLYQVSNPGIEIKRFGSVPVVELWKVVLVGLALTMVIILSMWYFIRFEDSTFKSIERYDINLPDEYPLAFIGSAHFGIGQTALAISPDGSMLVYAGMVENTTRLFLRNFDSYKVIELEGTDGAYSPFFSANGKWIGFFSNGYLMKVLVTGSRPINLCQVTNPSGAVWTSNDRIIFANNEGSNLLWISADGGTIQELLVEENINMFGSYEFPSLIEDKFILVSSQNPPGIMAISLENGHKFKLTDKGFHPLYLSSGHLCYVDHGRIIVVPFDKKNLKVKGEIISVIDNIRTENTSGQMAVSNQGDLIYARGISAVQSKVVFLSASKLEEKEVLESDYYGEVKMSPDGTALMVQNQNTREIYIYDLESLTMRRVTNDDERNFGIWGPGEDQITYNRVNEIFHVSTTGTEEPEPVLKGLRNRAPYGWSPDGSVLMYSSSSPATGVDIKFHPVAEEKDDYSLMPNKWNQMLASFSPDGDFVAYTSDLSGQSEVYVQPFPPDGRIWPISSNGGEEPIWSPNDNILYYRNNQDWYQISFSTENEFSIMSRKKLFSGPYLNVPGYSYDITSDGQFFILLKPTSDAQSSTKLKIVKNWFEEIKASASE